MATTTTRTRTNYAFTKAQALKIAFEVMSANPDEVTSAISKVIGDTPKADQTAENATRRVSHEVHMLAASSNRPKVESAASKRNTARANEWAELMADNTDGWTLNELCEHFNLVNSKGGANYAAAVAIINKLTATNRLEKLDNVRGKAYYRIKPAA